MKKLLLLISLLFIVSGCSATYNIEIKDNKIYETLSIIEKNKNLWDSKRANGLIYRNQILDAKSWPLGSFYDKQTSEYEAEKVDGFEYYDISLINNTSSLGLKYSYTFDNSNYDKSTLLRNCFSNVSKYTNNGLTVITTSVGFKCFNDYDMLENVKVNIVTDYEVQGHNADSVNGTTYSWSINKNNANKKIIYIKYYSKTNKKDEQTTDEKVKSFWKTNWYIFVIILFCLLVIGLFIFNNINEKNKNNNRL